MISTLSLPTQPIRGCTTPPVSTPPTLYEQQCWFFYVPQESEQWNSCETGTTVFLPYLGRLECLTICRWHNKGSTFSILRSWVACLAGAWKHLGTKKKTGARERDTGGSLSPRVSPSRAPSFFAPTTSKRPPSRLDLECWSGRGFNLRPLARQTSPLPIELTGRRFKKY